MVPARATAPGVDLIELFVGRAIRAQMTVARLAHLREVPAEAARLAREHGSVGEGLLATSVAPRLGPLAWRVAGLDASCHPPTPLHPLSITDAWAAIAETGTCVVRGGAENAHAASVLTRLNLIVLEVRAVVATLEDVFARARAESVPRVLLFVHGPSRTGDIGSLVVTPAQGTAHVRVALID